MPDRLPSLIYLVGCWVPPALAGLAAADIVRRNAKQVSPAFIYSALMTFALAWSGAWFAFHLTRIPPYVPGATHDPRFASPEAVRGLTRVASGVVLPLSAIACVVAFRWRKLG